MKTRKQKKALRLAEQYGGQMLRTVRAVDKRVENKKRAQFKRGR